ncbi:MAG: FecR domain-containing protein, partial [Ferruginibacter sp.]
RENKTLIIANIGRRKLWYAAAAVLLIGVLSIGLKFLVSNAGKPQLATEYGQIKQDKLPDGTEIILNANSKLTYPRQWKEGTDREVWIKGEAFFHVKKTVQHNKFIVHTDAFDIEVTGTSFDVINREGKSSIILKEGSVKIHRPGEAEILMKPGDFVEFTNEQIQKKTVTKQDYLAWTESKLVFDNTALKDVVTIIKQHYGVDVKLMGNDLAEKTITGIMPNNNLDVLLEALEATQEFTIKRIDNIITITNKN